jgi:hypothetical protein
MRRDALPAVSQHHLISRSTGVRLAGLVALAVLAGCNRSAADWRAGHPDAQADPSPTGYVRPPQVLAAARTADGGEVLSGQAEPDVRLRLASPDGGAYGATADDHGRWSIVLPADYAVRLFGLSEEMSGRVVQGEGYIAALPAPGRAGVLLRAGAGAAPLEASPALQIIAVDFDGAGGGVVSGTAHAGSPVRSLVDGAAGGDTHAGGRGVYSMPLVSAAKAGDHSVQMPTIKPGDHVVQVQSAGAVAQAKVTIAAAQPLAGTPPYRGARFGDGWRIDWLTPGGGPQTTLVFDPPGAAP